MAIALSPSISGRYFALPSDIPGFAPVYGYPTPALILSGASGEQPNPCEIPHDVTAGHQGRSGLSAPVAPYLVGEFVCAAGGVCAVPSLQLVVHAPALGLEVALVVPARLHNQRGLLEHRDAVRAQRLDLGGIVRQQPDLGHVEVAQDLC